MNEIGFYDGQTEEEFLKEIMALLETLHDNIVSDDEPDTIIEDIRADSTQFVLLKTLKYLYHRYYGLGGKVNGKKGFNQLS